MPNTALKVIETAPTELVLLHSTPAKVEFNINELRENVREALKEYDLVVTAETVKGAKSLMADLNKKATGIKKVFKEASAKVTAPLDEAQTTINELAAEIVDARDKLKAQVERFETETKQKAYQLLTERQIEFWDAGNVRPEFRTSDTGNIVSLTCVTAKGSLTAGAVSKLKDLVAGDMALQAQTDHRLMAVENESYKAGLKAPLTRSHVEAFLFADSESYQARLADMLNSEKQRQDATEAAARQKFEEEAEVQRRKEALQAERQAQVDISIEAKMSEVRSQIKRRLDTLPYAEGQTYREEQRDITSLNQELAELEKSNRPTPSPQTINQADAFLLCSILDTSKPLVPPFESSDLNEVFHAALSESANRSKQQEPYYISVWSKANGRIAIVDGISGEVYQRAH